MKNKNKIICVIVLCLTITLSTLGIRTNVFALENSETIYEAKVYSAATIEDDFDGSSIIVVLDKSISEVNRVHSKEFFGDIDIESIEDLSAVESLEESYYNKEDFRQILSLKLSQDDKENVLQAIDILEQIDGIKYAGVNVNYTIQRTPNDIYYGVNMANNYNSKWPYEKIQLPEVGYNYGK